MGRSRHLAGFGRTLGALLVVALSGCEGGGMGPVGRTALAVHIENEGSFVSRADVGTLHVEGPTPSTLTIDPMESQTIRDLQPGTYTLSLEGLLGGRLEAFARTEVTVAAGEEVQAVLSLSSFTPPSLDLPASAPPGAPVSLSFGPVPAADGYIVEWDDSPGFTSPETAQVEGTSTEITFNSSGITYVRVRARGPYGTDGIPTEAETVVVNHEPTVEILAPSNGSTFTTGEAITFQGSAEDAEDGLLQGGALVWTSSLDGTIGTGETFNSTDLSAGDHAITLSATDTDGGVGTDSHSITLEPGDPVVRLGETPSSTVDVGGQVFLPILLDLDQTGGAYRIADLELDLAFSNVLLGEGTWTLGDADFFVTRVDEGTEGTTQLVTIAFSRNVDLAETAVLAVLVLDAAAVGSATVEVDVVGASDPDGVAIPPGLFTTVAHEIVIEAGDPNVQLLLPGASITGIDGGVRYYRVPVGPMAVPALMPRIGGDPAVVTLGEGRPHSDLPGTVDAANAGPAQEPSSAPGQTLRVQISGGVPDADLYLRLGELPTPNSFDCRPFLDGNDEGCDAIDAPDGDWFVMIRPFGATFADVRLQAFLFDAVTILTASLPDGMVGTPYEATLVAADGDGSYTWSLITGSLPPSLLLSEEGKVSGNPSVAGDYSFTLRAVSAGKAAQAEFTIAITQ